MAGAEEAEAPRQRPPPAEERGELARSPRTGERPVTASLPVAEQQQQQALRLEELLDSAADAPVREQHPSPHAAEERPGTPPQPLGAAHAVPDVEMGVVLAAFESSNDDAETPASVVLSDVATVDSWRRQLSIQSRWRWPSGPGKLPGYVCGFFRAKTFALLAMQLATVLCIMLAVELSGVWKKVGGGLIFFSLEFLAMILLVLLHCARDRYPVNYILLGLVTIVVGLRWGNGSSYVGALLHFQVVGILCVAMGIAAATSAARAHETTNTGKSVMFSLLLGWACGAILDAAVCLNASVDMLWSLLAIGITFCLLGWLLFDVGQRLVLCNPDDFMRIVVAMNSTLIVVVSIPVFAFGTFLIHATDRVVELERAAGQADPAQAREAVDGAATAQV